MANKNIVRFGDICREVKLSSKCPIADGYERYVGLEHLDSGSLNIKRWGIIEDDNPSFTRVFKKGHILLGKRRPYLRKAAIADFDGICSGDIIVLTGKDCVSNEFLARLIHTDNFWSWAVQTSSGSLSPRTKFSALTSLSLSVPELNKQITSNNILKKLDLYLDRKEELLLSAQQLLKALLTREIWEKRGVVGWKEYSISELGDVKLGRQRTPKYTTGNYTKPYLRVVNVLDGELDLSDVEEMDFNDRDFQLHKLSVNDVLITEGDITSVFNVGRVAIYKGEIDGCCIQNTLIRFRAGKNINPYFAFFLFRAAYYNGIFAYHANMTTVAHLGAERFCKIRVFVPDLKTQEYIIEKISGVDCLISTLQQEIKFIKNNLRSAITKKFIG